MNNSLRFDNIVLTLSGCVISGKYIRIMMFLWEAMFPDWLLGSSRNVAKSIIFPDLITTTLRPTDGVVSREEFPAFFFQCMYGKHAGPFSYITGGRKPPSAPQRRFLKKFPANMLEFTVLPAYLASFL